MSLGFSQITNDAKATIKFLDAYGQYFDKWFITVATKDKGQYNVLTRTYGNSHPKLNVSYHKWADDFAAARNANLKTINTDYWFWADTDDTIEHPERLRDLLKYMTSKDLDVLYLKYDYAQSSGGDAIADHWRERMIRTAFECKWDAPVHETLQGPPALTEQVDAVVVKHNKDKAAVQSSVQRNKKILEKHYKVTQDPRDAWYLGMTYLGLNEPSTAIKWFLKHINNSGSDEDKYRSWCRIADSEYLLEAYDKALFATDNAIKLRPAFPDAYYIKVYVYGTAEVFDKAIEWLKVAMSKPVPDTLAVIDPTLYEYRGIAMGAQCYLFSGRIKEAFKLYQEVLKRSPDVFDTEMKQLFEDAYYDQKATEYIRYLLRYTKDMGGNPTKIFESLPPRLFADARLNADRASFIKPIQWSNKSIAIYCGAGTESWGPDTLDKGMGGSEEAVLYLSRELAKLGWQVTVFNDREEEYLDVIEVGKTRYNPVIYKPWTLLNPNDTFDVFYAWRNPSLTRALKIKARKRIVDMHDTPVGHQTISKEDVKNNELFMFKSQYQREYAQHVPDDKAVVIGNGVLSEQFKAV